MNALAAILPREMLYQVVTQAYRNISGHDEPHNDASFFGIAGQIRKLDPSNNSNDVVRAFNGGAGNKHIRNYVGFGKGGVFNSRSHFRSPFTAPPIYAANSRFAVTKEA